MLRRHMLLGSGYFNPLDLGAPALWLSSRYPSSLWKERTTPTTQAILNGDVVGTWMDLSGNARHVTAPSDASRPTLVTGSLGGWPGIINDAGDDVLSASGTWLASLANVTVYSVWKPTAAAAANTFTAGSPLFLSDGTKFWYVLSGYTTGAFSGETIMPLAADPGPMRSGSSGYTRGAATAEILSGTFGASGLSFFQNGSSVSVNLVSGMTVATPCGPSVFNISPATLSLWSPTGAAPAITFYEIIVYPEIHTAEKRQYIKRGLGRAYGITVA